ncbi:MAG: IPTL-CTERM sorting domain-containing protein, partial [Candidatus Dadabacteria bacterium]|nr:IPTL-CTERM sorting domain-containing protein [Candidatus Dadabacteria bacterium]
TRAYVAITGSDNVSVIDTATNTTVGLPIPVGESPAGVAITPIMGTPIIRAPIPTLSEWGLIAMASILGIVGFMVLRRRKVAA